MVLTQPIPGTRTELEMLPSELCGCIRAVPVESALNHLLAMATLPAWLPFETILGQEIEPLSIPRSDHATSTCCNGSMRGRGGG